MSGFKSRKFKVITRKEKPLRNTERFFNKGQYLIVCPLTCPIYWHTGLHG